MSFKIFIIKYLYCFFVSLKNSCVLIARCVFVYTNFSSLIHKDDLAFSAKGRKNSGTCFSILNKMTFKIPK